METDNKPGVIRPWILITVIVLIIAAAGFFTWHYLQKNNALPLPATTSTTSPVITPKVTPSPVASETTDTTTPSTTPTTTPTVSPTTEQSFKTYTNSKYGFSFNYPNDYEEYPNSVPDPLSEFEAQITSGRYNRVYVNVFKYTDISDKLKVPVGFETYPTKSITIGGHEAISVGDIAYVVANDTYRFEIKFAGSIPEIVNESFTFTK